MSDIGFSYRLKWHSFTVYHSKAVFETEEEAERRALAILERDKRYTHAVLEVIVERDDFLECLGDLRTIKRKAS